MRLTLRVVSVFRIWAGPRCRNLVERESRHWESWVSKRNLDSSRVVGYIPVMFLFATCLSLLRVTIKAK